MILADVVLSPDVPIGSIVTGLAVTGGVGVMVFLLKRAFSEVVDGLAALRAEVRGMSDKMAGHDTSKALLERDVADCKAEVKLNRDRFHELAQQVTLLRGLLETKRTASGEHRALRDT